MASSRALEPAGRRKILEPTATEGSDICGGRGASRPSIVVVVGVAPVVALQSRRRSRSRPSKVEAEVAHAEPHCIMPWVSAGLSMFLLSLVVSSAHVSTRPYMTLDLNPNEHYCGLRLSSASGA